LDIPTEIKIKSIKIEDQEEMTYNLHVDRYNNFSVNGGLIVHNSIKAHFYALEQLSRLQGKPSTLSGSITDHKKQLIDKLKEERKKKREILKAQVKKQREEKKVDKT